MSETDYMNGCERSPFDFRGDEGSNAPLAPTARNSYFLVATGIVMVDLVCAAFLPEGATVFALPGGLGTLELFPLALGLAVATMVYGVLEDWDPPEEVPETLRSATRVAGSAVGFVISYFLLVVAHGG